MIRPATEADLPRLLELGREMHAESWYAGLPLSLEKVEAQLRECMQIGFMWVHESGGVVDAGMAGGIAPVWCSDALQAIDFALFVTKDRRGGMAAYRLVDRFWTWAHQHGAAEICLGVTTGLEGAGKLYEGMGMTRVGGLYRARIGGEDEG